MTFGVDCNNDVITTGTRVATCDTGRPGRSPEGTGVTAPIPAARAMFVLTELALVSLPPPATALLSNSDDGKVCGVNPGENSSFSVKTIPNAVDVDITPMAFEVNPSPAARFTTLDVVVVVGFEVP